MLLVTTSNFSSIGESRAHVTGFAVSDGIEINVRKRNSKLLKFLQTDANLVFIIITEF